MILGVDGSKPRHLSLCEDSDKEDDHIKADWVRVEQGNSRSDGINFLLVKDKRDVDAVPANFRILSELKLDGNDFTIEGRQSASSERPGRVRFTDPHASTALADEKKLKEEAAAKDAAKQAAFAKAAAEFDSKRTAKLQREATLDSEKREEGSLLAIEMEQLEQQELEDSLEREAQEESRDKTRRTTTVRRRRRGRSRTRMITPRGR